MIINIKSFEIGEKSGKKQALEDELKFLEDLFWILKGTVHSKVEKIIDKRITEIKQKLEKLK